jgi:hypothetical protein
LMTILSFFLRDRTNILCFLALRPSPPATGRVGATCAILRTGTASFQHTLASWFRQGNLGSQSVFSPGLTVVWHRIRTFVANGMFAPNALDPSRLALFSQHIWYKLLTMKRVRPLELGARNAQYGSDSACQCTLWRGNDRSIPAIPPGRVRPPELAGIRVGGRPVLGSALVNRGGPIIILLEQSLRVPT